MIPALGTIASSLTGLFGSSGASQAEAPLQTSTSGTYTAGGINITKEDSTIKIALIVAGVVLVAALFMGKKR